jgi:hypothetical protein
VAAPQTRRATGLKKAQRAAARPLLTILGQRLDRPRHRHPARPVRSFPRFAARRYPALFWVALCEYLTSNPGLHGDVELPPCWPLHPVTPAHGQKKQPQSLTSCASAKMVQSSSLWTRMLSAAMALLARPIGVLLKEALEGGLVGLRRGAPKRKRERAQPKRPRRGSVRALALRRTPGPLLP